jgi:acyl carrier protein
LDDLLSVIGIPPGDEDAPLEIRSLDVVTLVLEIEERCGVRLATTEVRRESFATRAALRALLRTKGISC